MNIKTSKKDILWSYIGTMLSMGANFLMLPFLIYFLDEDMLGLWYVFSSVGAIATLFDFGFAVTFARNITYCWSGAESLKQENVVFIEKGETNFYLMKQVLKTCKIIYALVSGVALFLLITIGSVYIWYISKDIVSGVPIIAWLIYSLAVFLNLYYGYYASFLRGVGAVEQANKNVVYARLLQILVTVILLFTGTGLIGACVAYLVYGTAFRILGKKHFYKYKNIGKNLAKVQKSVSKSQIKELFQVVWHNAWRDGLISICNYCCNQITTIICSMYLTLAETGVYSLGVQIASAIAQIAGTLYNTYQPELQSAYISRNKEKMKKIMSMIVVSFVYLYIIGVGLFTVFGIPFLGWIKSTLEVSLSTLVGLYIYQFILKFRNCYTSYFSCTNRIVYLNSFIISAVLCIVLSFIMLGTLHMGVWGLILAQIISQAVYNVWYWTIKAHKELGLPFITMFKLGTTESVQGIKKIVRISGKQKKI